MNLYLQVIRFIFVDPFYPKNMVIVQMYIKTTYLYKLS